MLRSIVAAPARLRRRRRGRRAAQSRRPLAIQNARLVTVSGGLVDRGTIVVERRLIAALGPRSSRPPERG
jgi:hypothetical protein